MNEQVKNTIILTVITLISGLLLGVVYQVTKDPIAMQQEKAKQAAYGAVFAEASSFEDAGIDISGEKDVLVSAGLDQQDITEVVKALDAGGEAIGYVFGVTTHEGYGGDINISVGIALDGTVKGVEILKIGETAGLGMKANTPEFKAQFKDRKVSAFRYTKTGASAEDEIDALSGATITSNAMTNGVNAAIAYFGSIQ